MTNSTHRIRRQRWTLKAGSTAAAFALRQHLRGDWQEVLLPAFETVFDQEAGSEDVVRIPRIELTLKVGANEKIDASWSSLIHEQLLHQLREALRAGREVRGKPTEWKQSTARKDRFQNLLQYLHAGFVPWEAGGLSTMELAAELQETCGERLPELTMSMRTGLTPPLAFCFRLLQLLPVAKASDAVRAILGEATFPWQASLLEMVGALLAPEQKHFGRYTQLQLAALFLSEALAAQRNTTVPDLVRTARHALPCASEALDDFLASFPAPAHVPASADFTRRAEAAAIMGTGVPAGDSNRTPVPKIPGVFRKAKPPAHRDASVPDSVDDARRAPPLGSELDDLNTSLPEAVRANAIAGSISNVTTASGKEPGLSTESASPAALAEIPGVAQKEDSPSASHATMRDPVHSTPFKSKALNDLSGSLPTPGGARAADDTISKVEAATPGETGLRKGDSNPAFKPEISGALQKEESRSRARDTISKAEAAVPGETGLCKGDSNPAPRPEIPDVFQKEELRARANQWTQSWLSKPASEAAFPLLAAHAGLILLHPFLPRFFESTGVKEPASVELSSFALSRAAALLHFLATGRDAAYEYDLVFIKVLLGLNPETPLCVSEGLLVEADPGETEALLESAITHWTALKNTSIAGFRSSFLDRRALLREEDNGWRLQVERQPFDVLLEHLPWSISVVKLPWMKRLIHTEW